MNQDLSGMLPALMSMLSGKTGDKTPIDLEKVAEILSTPEGQSLLSLLMKTGSNAEQLKKLAESALEGGKEDPSELLNKLLQSDEAASLKKKLSSLQ